MICLSVTQFNHFKNPSASAKKKQQQQNKLICSPLTNHYLLLDQTPSNNCSLFPKGSERTLIYIRLLNELQIIILIYSYSFLIPFFVSDAIITSRLLHYSATGIVIFHIFL